MLLSHSHDYYKSLPEKPQNLNWYDIIKAAVHPKKKAKGKGPLQVSVQQERVRESIKERCGTVAKTRRDLVESPLPWHQHPRPPAEALHSDFHSLIKSLFMPIYINQASPLRLQAVPASFC